MHTHSLAHSWKTSSISFLVKVFKGAWQSIKTLLALWLYLCLSETIFSLPSLSNSLSIFILSLLSCRAKKEVYKKAERETKKSSFWIHFQNLLLGFDFKTKMATQNRRSSFSTSTTSSLAKRHASSSSSENVGKVMAVPSHMAKKRAPLSNVTNLKNVSHTASRNSLTSSTLVLSLFINCLKKCMRKKDTEYFFFLESFID